MNSFNLSNLKLAALAAFATLLTIAPSTAHAACAATAASALPYSVPGGGMTGAVAISAPAGCQWNFNSRGSAWIQILSPLRNTGSAVIYFRVLPNTSGRARSAAFGPEGITTTVVTIGNRSSGGGGTQVVSTGFAITLTQAAR